MSGKESKRSPYWLRERNNKISNIKKRKLESQLQAGNSHQNKMCGFVEKCLAKAQKKKLKQNASKSTTSSKEILYTGMEMFVILIFLKLILLFILLQKFNKCLN